MSERAIDLLMDAGKFAAEYTKEYPLAFDGVLFGKFAELLVDEFSEIIRDVLRDESSGLDYETAERIQQRIKETFPK